MVIFDTDILIHCERGNGHALELLNQAEGRCISSITEMELLQGARSTKELRETRIFLMEYGFSVLPLTENIGHRATLYIEEYTLVSGLHLTDALIAATAMERGLVLVTGNVKNFKMIPGLQVKAFRP